MMVRWMINYYQVWDTSLPAYKEDSFSLSDPISEGKTFSENSHTLEFGLSEMLFKVKIELISLAIPAKIATMNDMFHFENFQIWF